MPSQRTYASRTADALDDIVAELETITTGNGYNYSPSITRAVRPADQIPLTSNTDADIGVEIGEEEMSPKDDNASVFDSFVNVYVVGTAMAETSTDTDTSELTNATEALRHDIKRIIAGMYYKYISPTEKPPKWNVVSGTVIISPTKYLGKKRNKAQVWAKFRIHIRNQSSDTLAAAHGTAYGTQGAGFYGF